MLWFVVAAVVTVLVIVLSSSSSSIVGGGGSASPLVLFTRAVTGWFSRLYLWMILPLPKKQQQQGRGAGGGGGARVSALYMYPVKSLRSVPLEAATLDGRGFVGDRRFMLVTPAPPPTYSGGKFGPTDATHRFLTQRQCPSLATVQAALASSSNEEDQRGELLTLTNTKDESSVTVSAMPAPNAPLYRAKVWNDIVLVRDMGDEASQFLHNIVKRDEQVADELLGSGGVRLVVQDAKEDRRATNDLYVPAAARTWCGEAPAVMLSDGYPLLIATEASLAKLNEKIAQRRSKEEGKQEGEEGKQSSDRAAASSEAHAPLPMSRFRPNIVLSGTQPFEEDEWKVVRIGNVLLHVVKGCPRCKESCTDQVTGRVTAEPVATLAEFRAKMPENPANVYFAADAIPAPGMTGRTVRVGDPVEVLRTGEPVWGNGAAG